MTTIGQTKERYNFVDQFFLAHNIVEDFKRVTKTNDVKLIILYNNLVSLYKARILRSLSSRT